MTEVLRLALYCDEPEVCGLGRRIIDDLKSDGRFEFVLVIRGVRAPREGRWSPTGLAEAFRLVLWNLAEATDRLLSVRDRRRNLIDLGYDVDTSHAVETLLPEVPEIPLQPDETSCGQSCRPRTDNLKKIGAYQIDVILRFCPDPTRGEIKKLARFGVWYLELADHNTNAGRPAGFWEWYHSVGKTAITLQAQYGSSDAGFVVAQASYRTFDLSWNENRRRVCAASSLLMLDALRKLTGQRSPPARPCRLYKPFDQRLTPLPGAAVSLTAVSKVLWRRAAFVVAKLGYREKWSLLIHEGAPGEAPISRFQALTPPKGHIWADPFLLSRNGRQFIFFEDMSYAEGKGKIAVIEIKDGLPRGYRRVIDAPYHLSFPFVFDFEGQPYIIPESQENNAIEVWRCQDFPDKWAKHCVLMDNVSALDTVLFFDDETWWMFTTLTRVKQFNGSELHVFYSDHPFSQSWQSHPQNPVVREARTGRMGGRVFRTAAGQIIRCAQDNRVQYGNGIVFCEVLCLTRDAYEERIVDELRPRWDPQIIGTHHIDSDGLLTVIDARSRVLKPLS